MDTLPLSSDFADPFDRATTISLMHEHRSLQKKLDEIHQAKSVEGLEYCEECDELIPLQRRKAVPSCRLCVHCQSDFESEKRHIVRSV